ncbi:MAG TPA: AIR synthase-related protein, partial [Allosphingosinicella sp.]
SGAVPGDCLWVTGAIGDAGAGLAIARGADGPPALLDRYRRPQPRLAAGQALCGLVHAMMDVSDGLLIDARRLAEASGAAMEIEFSSIPLSEDFVRFAGLDREARLRAATAGDDYELLFAAPATNSSQIEAIAIRIGIPMTCIGKVIEGSGLRLKAGDEDVPLPASLGYEHQGQS